MNRTSRLWVCLLAVVTLAIGALLVTMPVSAIEVRGSITGTVSDPTGAVIPGATVTITNEGTGVSRTVQTDSGGVYIMVELLPGPYTVKVEKAGFRTAESRGVLIRLNVRDVQDISLEVGATTETVQVEATAVHVETSGLASGGSMDSKTMGSMPLVARNWTDLAKLLPGVQENSDRLGNSINGGRSTSNNFLFGGIDSNDPALNTPLVIPNPDAIGEFRLINATGLAEYARNSGSVLNAIPKSGTNDFHGTLGFFYRVKGLTARNFFVAVNPNFNRFQYSATLGGPIIKDKTFFFASYQGFHQIAPSTFPARRVFTAAERACIDNPAVPCNFSADFPLGFPGTNITGFAVGGCAAGAAWNACFPGALLPASAIHPLAAQVVTGLTGFFPGLPLPTQSGGIFSAAASAPSRNYQYLARLNHNFRAGHSLDGTLFASKTKTISPFPFDSPLGTQTATVPGFATSQSSIITNFSVSYTHIFSPRVVNEARFGYNRLNFNTVNPVNPYLPSAVGFTGIRPNNPVGSSAPGMFNNEGWFGWGWSQNGPQPRIDETTQWTDNVTWLKGSHNLKFGFDHRDIGLYNPFWFNNDGGFTFLGDLFNSTGGPDALGTSPGVQFLLGLPDQYFQGSGAINHPSAGIYYLYAQDDWRIKPTVTLNLGIGWSLRVPSQQLTDQRQLMSQLCPGRRSSVFPAGTQFDPNPNNVTFAGDIPTWIGPPSGFCYPRDTGRRGTIAFRKKDFGPRLGIAWAPRASSGLGRWITGGPGKFSIRAAWGIFYNSQIEELQLQFISTPPLSQFNQFGDQATTPINFAQPFCAFGTTCASVGPYPFGGTPLGANVDWVANFFLPMFIQGYSPGFKNAYAQNWHVTLERKFGQNWLARFAYVGSKGTNLETAIERLSEGDNRYGTGGTLTGLPSGRALLGGQDPSFLNRDVWGSFSEQVSDINSIYNSFQASLEKRFSRGFSLLASYTWSHSLDAASNNGVEDTASTPFARFRDRSNSNFDVRQRFVVSYVWDIPAPNWTGVRGKLVKGWQIGGITTFATGFPFSLSSTTTCDGIRPFSFFGYPCRPDFKPGFTAANFAELGDPRTTPGNSWFSGRATGIPTADNIFRNPVAGSIGNTPKREFHGPGLNNWDIGLYKNTYINEEKTTYVQLRFEFFNAFNHVQFNNPNGSINSTNFGRITSARAARIVQLGVRVVF